MATRLVDLLDSANQKYDNSTSGLAAATAQDAIDELAGLVGEASGGGFSTVSAQTDQATVTAATSTLYVVTTGATNPTCTVNLPVPSGAGEQLGILLFAVNAETDSVVVHPATGDEIDNSTSDVTLSRVGEYVQLVAQGDSTNWLVTSHKGAEPIVYVQTGEPANPKLGAIWVEV